MAFFPLREQFCLFMTTAQNVGSLDVIIWTFILSSFKKKEKGNEDLSDKR